MSQYEKVLKKILRKTNEGEIEWRTTESGEDLLLDKGEELASPIYFAKHKGRKILLAELKEWAPKARLPSQMNPHVTSLTDVKSAVQQLRQGFSEERDWDTKVKVAVKNPKTGGTWTFPESGLASDVLKSAKRQSSKVDEWMMEVLDED